MNGPPATAAAVRETPLSFDCDGEALVGIVSEPVARVRGTATWGVVVVVGGPQVRVGSHRQFVGLARAVAAAGHVALRFDVRGMGDSTGPARDFLALSDDIAAAVSALRAHAPWLDGIVLWGLCDGASAALLYLADTPDAHVHGLCLVNPWVRTPQVLAQVRVRHYYLERLRDRGFWHKLLAGRVGGSAVRGLWDNLRAARRGGGADAQDYRARMAAAWQRFGGPTLLVLSGRDFTAKEFLAHVENDRRWATLLARPDVRRHDAADADHTFSSHAQQRSLEELTCRWLDELEPRPCVRHG